MMLALVAVPVASATPNSAEMKPFACANILLLPKGEYLKAADLLTEAKKNETNPLGGLHQFGNVTVSFVTGEPETPSASPAAADKSDLRRLSHAQLRDAVGEIVERARRTSIVILNEEHQSPRDRAFALEVGRALRPLGYSILAVEAFHSSPDAAERARKAKRIASDGYLHLDSGVYTLDPVFAAFVRQSLALGYRPVVYEFVSTKGAARPVEQREQGEADNLMSAIFTKTPKAKVVIYVGYDHAAEEPIDGFTWLAARLKKMTGVDPLTIDQTTLSPSSNGAIYASLKSRIGARSVVPMAGGRPVNFGALGRVIDLEVAHPPTHLERGRPDWLYALGRSPIEVPRNLRPRTGRVLVQAFLANEAPDAVPVDQVIVRAGEDPPPLLVPPGPIRFAVRYGFRPGDCDSAPQR